MVAEPDSQSLLDHYRAYRKAAAGYSDLGKQRLEEALRMPIEEPGESQVSEWYVYVRGAFPLWSLNRETFNKFYGPNSATTYPLVDMAQSVTGDEDSRTPGTLPGTLHMRRHYFMSGLEVIENWGLKAVRKPGVTIGSSAGLYFDPDMRPYADDWGFAIIGRDLLMHLEAVDRASGGKERGKATKKLERFLSDLRGTKPGRPREGPDTDLLKALVLEGKELFRLLWDHIPFEVSERTEQALRDALGEDGEQASVDDLRLWSARLTLPFLSEPEIRALLSEAEESRRLNKKIGLTTPRLFTIWALARRLRMLPATVAAKTLGNRDADYFVGKRENPIDAFLTG